MADLWVSTFFGNVKVNEAVYQDLVDSIWHGGGRIPQKRRDEIKSEAQKIAETKRFFHWEVAFPEAFFDKTGELLVDGERGFDAVIGNPPYFNVDTFGKKSPEQGWLKKAYSDIWQDKSDILFYFLTLGLYLSRKHLTMIVSNAFLASDKAQRLRGFLAQNATLRALVDFRDFPVFEEVGIATCIPLIRKMAGSERAPCLEVIDPKIAKSAVIQGLSNFGEGQGLVSIKGIRSPTVIIPALGGRWVVSDDKDRLLCKKIDAASSPLGDLFTVGEGMQTGCNKAFKLSCRPPHGDTPFSRVRVMGEDIKRYILGEPCVWLIWPEDLNKPEDGPSWLVKQLRQFEPALKSRAAFQRGNCEWFKFTWPLHKESYGLRKLWCSYRARTNAFAYDDSSRSIGLTNTTVIFDTNDHYNLLFILALLNSNTLT
jgi:hypothetical protein